MNLAEIGWKNKLIMGKSREIESLLETNVKKYF